MRQRMGHWPRVLAALVWVGLILPGAPAGIDRVDLLRQADQLERQGHWAEATERYDQLPPRDRNSPDLRRHYLLCLRHVHQAQRHGDPTYRQQILTLDLAAASRAYDEVLAKIQATYVDRADPEQLFRQGLDELDMALADDAFRRDYLPGVSAAVIEAFRQQLGQSWGRQPAGSRREIQRLARDLAQAGQQALDLRPAAVLLELASGACNGLDEYTSYLTPRELAETYAAFKGEVVGVGISDLAAESGRLVIKAVLPGSPAAREGVQPEDYLRRIDRLPAHGLAPAAVLERLRGEAGSAVELEIVPAAGGPARTLTMTRATVLLRSVSDSQFIEPGIGYLQVAGFQETTADELEKAIADLRLRGMRVLMLDLRGNPGGLFDVAVRVAERFLSAGVVVATQSPVEGQSRTYEAHTPDPLTIPLVVLVDGDTASAAEVLAGALKEGRRATLVGQPTYGKGSVQCVLRLETVPAGIRVTLAKFFSPLGHAYQGLGVAPHVLVAQASPGFDDQRQAGVQVARELVMGRR